MAAQTYQRRVLHADLETPVSTYLKLGRDTDWAFLYESVEGRSVWAHYSILGFGARHTFVLRDGGWSVDDRPFEPAPKEDPFAALRRAVSPYLPSLPADAPRFLGGIFGFAAYDAIHAIEPVGGRSRTGMPELCFFQPELLAVFDHRQHSLSLYALDPARLDEAVTRLQTPLERNAENPARTWVRPEAVPTGDAHRCAVAAAQEHIRAGDVIQVVLSRTFSMPRLVAPFDIYRGLRTVNPSPYLFFLQSPHLELAGASPEVMVRVLDGSVSVRPIAGTRPRGASPSEDAKLAEALKADPKEIAEHIMLVDLGRNDVGRVAEAGSVRVDELMVIEHYSHVMHLVSQVHGNLNANRGLDAFDAVRAAFPAGTLTGAPKVRAMQLIAALEAEPRGLYGGAVGYFGPRGDADFGIAIRTVEALPDTLVVRAGGGIVADSDPHAETRETEAKAEGVLRAIRWAHDHL